MAVLQVWKCPQCATVYNSPLRVKEAFCSNPSHGLKQGIRMVLIEGNLPPERKKKK